MCQCHSIFTGVHICVKKSIQPIIVYTNLVQFWDPSASGKHDSPLLECTTPLQLSDERQQIQYLLKNKEN